MNGLSPLKQLLEPVAELDRRGVGPKRDAAMQQSNARWELRARVTTTTKEHLTGMFDPTIFDNLKVVLEGSCYDLDREGEAVVTGREDVLDLASLGRTFVMRLALPGGRCEAEWSLESGLSDFAMELAGLRRATEQPGAVLRLRLTMPPVWASLAAQADAILKGVWGDGSEVRHEYRLAFDPQAGASLDGADGSLYAVDVRFGGKIDESELDALDGMLRKSVLCLSQLEQLGEGKL